MKKQEEAREKAKEKGLNNSKTSNDLDSMDGKTPRSPRGVLVCGLNKGDENSAKIGHTTVQQRDGFTFTSSSQQATS